MADGGTEVFTGNELLVKGALEADGGTHLLGGYPGSPVSGYFDSITTLKDVLHEKGVRAVINNNEALAAAMLNGSQTLPVRAMIVMKSVGVHVAADALALGNLAGAHREGGAIVVYGDDPWCDSTQVPADSRYISKHLFIPTIEPSNPQEVKDFVDLSYKLSAACELFTGYIITNNLADGGGTVICKPNQYPKINIDNRLDLVTKAIDLNKRVLLPPKTWWQEEALFPRHRKAMTMARKLGLNKIEFPAEGRKKPLGFVAAGLGHDYLLHALHEMGLPGEFPILKFGLSYPVDPEMIEQLAGQCERIVVVEERRGFMEEQIAEILIRQRSAGGPAGSVELFGKEFPHDLPGIPRTRGLHPSILIERLAPLIEKSAGASISTTAREGIRRELSTIAATENVEIGKLPFRYASFCPGCPHRDSASLCLEIKRAFLDPHYMAAHHSRTPVDLLFHGDTGCYTMLMFPPNTDLMHDYSGMGLGAGTGSGTDKFTTNKEVVFMGDSTFFHSGQIAVSQAIKLRQDITFIILDNSTTGMTGHQPTPGVDYDVLGDQTPTQSIDSIVRGIAGGDEVRITRFNPELRLKYRALLEETFLADGVKVIIADKECGITRMRRKRREERATIRKKGYLPAKEYMNINQEICRFCLACSEITGCPGLRHVETDYGRKMDTDPSWCVADGSCQRVGACDAFERIVVQRKREPKSKVPELHLDDIPEPQKRNAGDLWRCCLTGVGGMGIGLATSILVRAGHKEGYDVAFLDKKGLAIRNGGVVSQVVFTRRKQPVTAIIPYGKADLLLGVDILEAARTLDPTGRARFIDPKKTAAVVNTDKIATISGVMGREDYNPEQLEKLIREHTREDYFLARNISRLCEKYLGGKIYANIMMMGYAFQRGLIPVSMHSMAWAIKDAIQVDFRQNLYAFNMGRKLVESPELFQGAPRRVGWKETLDEKIRYTRRRYGKKNHRGDDLEALVTGALANMSALDESLKRDIVIRAYDCMRWGGIPYANRYCDQVSAVYAKDHAEYEYAATRAVVHMLAEAMLIKDGIFKAELATSKEKYRRDHEKYNINRANGDRVRYKYLWKRHIRFGGKEFRLDIPVWGWQLKALKRMRRLRPLLKPWWKYQYKHLADYERAVSEFQYGTSEEYFRQMTRLASPRCLHCDSPACSTRGCPLDSDIPEWIELAQHGRWREASDRLHEKNNFPEFTALLCPAFCQTACHQAINDQPVQVREWERQIIDRAFAEGFVLPQPAKTKTHKRVAVVGSGPAGLAAAQQLARAGHDVTVIETEEEPGGLLRTGIPEFRLPKELIDRRLEQLRAEGVQFTCGVEIGVDVKGEKLLADYDAVCLAVGAAQPRDLNIPGREKQGVVQAMDFLRHQNRAIKGHYVAGAVDAKGKAVAVIGGGLTGEDCVETALKQGASEVHQLEILPRAQAALGHAKTTETLETVEQHYEVDTREFIGTDGRLSSLRARRVKYVPSARGPVRQDVPGGDFTLEAEVAILALGFEASIDPRIVEQLRLKTDEKGRVLVNESHTTSVEHVFAAGDAVTGPSYVATAIDSGRRAAKAIHAYLARET
ncbi:MAG: FAD-dependent oxidoreductase [Phycisphaerae bacterium]|nr:FAD-dependent oxidoreductase [Phycisphaerae bacterium]